MIQATDFVCPVCKSQVGKRCTNQERGYAHGEWVMKAVYRFGKPHAERRRLAKDKRERKAP